MYRQALHDIWRTSAGAPDCCRVIDKETRRAGRFNGRHHQGRGRRIAYHKTANDSEAGWRAGTKNKAGAPPAVEIKKGTSYFSARRERWMSPWWALQDLNL